MPLENTGTLGGDLVLGKKTESAIGILVRKEPLALMVIVHLKKDSTAVRRALKRI
jgi:hypothetical protein